MGLRRRLAIGTTALAIGISGMWFSFYNSNQHIAEANRHKTEDVSFVREYEGSMLENRDLLFNNPNQYLSQLKNYHERLSNPEVREDLQIYEENCRLSNNYAMGVIPSYFSFVGGFVWAGLETAFALKRRKKKKSSQKA